MGTTAEKLQKLISTKAAIKTSLENKGLTPTDKFDTYPALIDSISGGGSGDVDIDFIASENINAGDKVYLKVVPASIFNSKTYVKVSANTYYACNSSETGQYYYYYDGTTLTKNSTEFKGVKFLSPDIDNCFTVTATGVGYCSNINTGVSTIYATQSGYTLSSVHIYPLTKTKYIIVIGEYQYESLWYNSYGIAYLVTLSDDLSSVLSKERIKSDGGNDLNRSTQSYLSKITDKKYLISFSVQGSNDGPTLHNVAYSYYEVVFADDYSTFTATKITPVSSPAQSIVPTTTYNRYYGFCEGNCFYYYSDGLFHYRDNAINKKATSKVPDSYNSIVQYSDGKMYVKKFKASIQTSRVCQTNGYNNYTFLGTNYGYDIEYYNIIVSHVVKSGGIFVGYAKTSATAGNNVTVSMVADYILDTEDVQ